MYKRQDILFSFAELTRLERVRFGKVADGMMKLSEIGEIAQQCWEDIPVHFPFVLLDEFVVMPNHIHGIVVIDKGDMDDIGNVETQNLASLQKNDTNLKTNNKQQIWSTIQKPRIDYPWV